MKTMFSVNAGTVALATVILCGCATGPNQVGITNQNQPGPAVGRAIGAGVGAVGGNVAGFGVGLAEGATGAVHSTFDNTQRVVRYWREETMPDGRSIKVSEEWLLDKDGRPVRRIK